MPSTASRSCSVSTFLLKSRIRWPYKTDVAIARRSAVMDNVVTETCGEWFVRVVEKDQEIARSFNQESFALSFAEGQRIRLGLAKVVRL
ncbi:hypothetical protein [Mesorhizobium sp. M0674]|uniref:hypothetical protein n=1 Tax=unclassified Mesorhizobium TaxID=325217 RepID=UPI003336705B